jgi:hypothetical protein
VLRCNGDFMKEVADFAQSPAIDAWLEIDGIRPINLSDLVRISA